MANLHVSVPGEVLERLRERSRRTDVPVARIVLRAVEQYLGCGDAGRRVGEMMVSKEEARREVEAIWPGVSARPSCAHRKSRFTGYGRVCVDCGAVIK